MDTIIPNSLLFDRTTTSCQQHICPLRNINKNKVNYKNIDLLKNYISEQGKIVPSRVSHMSSKKQKALRRAIQVARHIALLPYTTLT